jgi:urate oxidase
LTVAIALTGDFEAAHVAGDNAGVYPTDSMKNSVYIVARRHGVGEVEIFAELLAGHLLARATEPASVEIEISARLWAPIPVGGVAHPHAFAEAGAERRAVRLVAERGGATTLCGGIDDLLVLKTTDSAFEGFPRDETTTLAETGDRIFATVLEARWRYAGKPTDYGAAWRAARTALLETFAAHQSLSVQHTLHAMGEKLLEAVAEVDEVRLRLPNRHHLLVDLRPFGLDNPNLVFVATSEPYGDIRAVIQRSAR